MRGKRPFACVLSNHVSQLSLALIVATGRQPPIVHSKDEGACADLGDEPHPARLFRPIQSRLSACVARSGDARPASRAIAS